MHLANKLHRDFKEYFSESTIVGKSLTYTQLSKMLNLCVRKYGVKVRVSRDNSIMNRSTYRKRQKFYFSGYYLIHKKKNPIYITIHVPDKESTFTLTKNTYRKFIFEFSRILQHEFIHKVQYTYRPEESDRIIKVLYSEKLHKLRKEEIAYLTVRCEVEAYAHDIAMEIHRFYSMENSSSIIKNIDKKRKLVSYNRYKMTFKGLHWDRLKKSLLRKIWKWLPSAHIP